MDLYKTSFLSGLGVLIKTLTMLIINKVLAVYVGPSGFAAIGQFQNALQLFSTFANGAVNTGVTKLTAEHLDNNLYCNKIISTGFMISLVGLLITCPVLFIFSNNLSFLFFDTGYYTSLFKYFSFSIPLIVLNSFLLSILHGRKLISLYVLSNITGSILALLFVVIASINYAIDGALFALATYQAANFFVTLYIAWKKNIIDWSSLIQKVDPNILRVLIGFTLMALTSSICVPLSHIYIRSFLTDSLGIEYAGNWEALWRLSGGYMMLFMSTLSVYFLPRYSELKNIFLIKKELLSGYFLLLPSFMLMCLFIYVFIDPITVLLFTEDFGLIKEPLLFQLLGDIFKVSSWLISYMMFSKGMVKTFIVLEVTFAFSFCVFTTIFIDFYGFSGVAIAHLLNYVIYLVVVYLCVYRKLKTLEGHYFEKV